MTAAAGSARRMGGHVQLRLAAALLGGLLAGLTAAAGYLLDIQLMAFVATLGVPVAGLIGFAYAPEVTSTPTPGRLALKLAFIAPTVGIAVLGAGAWVAWLISEPGPAETEPVAALGGLMFVLALVVFNAYLLGLPVTIPVSVVAVVLLRRLARTRRPVAFVIVGTIVIATPIVGLAAVSDYVAHTGIAAGRPWVDPGG